jgi:hypothetical protein
MRWGWRCRWWRRRRRSFWNGLGVRVSGVPGSEGVWRASSSTGEAKKLDPARLPQRSRARQKKIGSATDACRRGSFVDRVWAPLPFSILLFRMHSGPHACMHPMGAPG